MGASTSSHVPAAIHGIIIALEASFFLSSVIGLGFVLILSDHFRSTGTIHRKAHWFATALTTVWLLLDTALVMALCFLEAAVEFSDTSKGIAILYITLGGLWMLVLYATMPLQLACVLWTFKQGLSESSIQITFLCRKARMELLALMFLQVLVTITMALAFVIFAGEDGLVVSRAVAFATFLAFSWVWLHVAMFYLPFEETITYLGHGKSFFSILWNCYRAAVFCTGYSPLNQAA